MPCRLLYHLYFRKVPVCHQTESYENVAKEKFFVRYYAKKQIVSPLFFIFPLLDAHSLLFCADAPLK